MILTINVQSLTKLSALRMRVHWSYPYWRNIYDIHCSYFPDYLHQKNTYSCIGMLSIVIFDIQKRRCLQITLDHIFSCCVSCNGLSIDIIVIFMEHSWQHILSSKPLEIISNWNGPNKTNNLKGPDSCRRPGRPDGLDQIRPAGTVVPIRTII